jgi:hypothetical protein
MFRPGAGGLGPTIAIQLGKQIGSKAHLRFVFDGAWRHAAQDVTVTSRCSAGRTCLFLGDSGDREERLAAAVEVLLYDHTGGRGGYVVGGFGLARYAAGGDRSGAVPVVHGGLGVSLRIGPTNFFTEARLAKVFDPGPFPGWTLAALGGVRLTL